jgi:hypothetical protein
MLHRRHESLYLVCIYHPSRFSSPLSAVTAFKLLRPRAAGSDSTGIKLGQERPLSDQIPVLARPLGLDLAKRMGYQIAGIVSTTPRYFANFEELPNLPKPLFLSVEPHLQARHQRAHLTIPGVYWLMLSFGFRSAIFSSTL